MLTVITVWMTAKLRPYFGDAAKTAAEWLFFLGGLLAVSLVVLAVVLGVRSYWEKKQVRETSARVEAAKIEVIKAHSDVEQLKSAADATDAEIFAAKEKAKEKEKELLKVIQEDSTTRDTEADAAFSRFCSLYPTDSLCR